VNAFTPDNKQMVYNSPERHSRAGSGDDDDSKVLVPNTPPPAAACRMRQPAGRGGRGFGGGARAIVVGHKTNSVFFTRMDPVTRSNAVYKADTNTGAIRKLIDLPPRVSISSVNADETLGAGTYNEADCPGGDPNAPNAFDAAAPAGGLAGGRWRTVRGWLRGSRRTGGFGSRSHLPQCCCRQHPHLGGANVQSDDKGAMMERRLAQRIPVVLFTIRLEPGPNGEKAGTIKPLLHSTDWIEPPAVFALPTRSC
jgi:oligogalacturonide lyase